MKQRNITPEMLNDLYINQNKSKKYLKKLFNISDKVINRWLKECGVIEKTGLKYSFNQHVFDVIDTSEKAYWIGFIWCDGYVCKRERKRENTINMSYEFKLSLSEQDVDHLVKFNKFLDSNYEIKKYKHGKSSYNKDGFECRIYICNKYFAAQLYNNYGMIPNRYDISKLINKIPDIYYRDFIRGIIDAEGYLRSKYVFDSHVNRQVYKSGLSISTYKNLLEVIQEYFCKHKLIKNKSKIYQRHIDRDAYCREIDYSGNIQVPRILNYIYKDATIYLERKYNTYLDILNHTTNHHNVAVLKSCELLEVRLTDKHTTT